MTKRLKIVVDADACPVKDEIVAAAAEYGADVWMVASYDHYLPPREGVQNFQVDRSDQSVDLYIANRLSAGDILITQDFGLAAIGISKGAVVLSNRGQIYTDKTIGFLLERRNEQARIRRGGGRTKGPRAMTKDDRHFFLHTLTKVLSGTAGNFVT
ncbi:YaiI/YqxD family protein [Gorillibacterium massiliense]|uniref:YaiI/YqxD family protein n=1 Tax=Gorillibacterium massiliense TaxID=1280390 RepID=UPI0004B6C8CC|nr:YaiI/YqxD family protein [Gorillibacterium massiliense]